MEAADVDDAGTLSLYRRRLGVTRRLTARCSLSDVAAISWDIKTFDPSGELYVKLWDCEPDLEFGGLGIQPRTQDLRYLMKIPQRVLRRSPQAVRRLQQLSNAGIPCNINLDTLEPIPELLPPLAAGVSFAEDGAIMFSPPDGL